MLKYLEVFKKLDFIKFSTFPLEVQVVIKEDYDTANEDDAYVIAVVEYFRMLFDQEKYRLHTQNQILILDYLNSSKISVDNITQFGLRTPELCELFHKLANYHC